MTPLVLGIVLIAGGIVFAAAPLLRRRSQEGGEESEAQPQRAAPAVGIEPAASGAALQLADAPPPLDGTIAVALEELDLDLAMGKLGARDYEELRAALVRGAESAAKRASVGGAIASDGTLPDEAAPESAPTADAVDEPETTVTPSVASAAARDLDAEAERLVRSLRQVEVSCPDCGPRPEPDAAFCSHCGRALGGCPSCGASISQDGARFCDRCGTALTR